MKPAMSSEPPRWGNFTFSQKKHSLLLPLCQELGIEASDPRIVNVKTAGGKEYAPGVDFSLMEDLLIPNPNLVSEARVFHCVRGHFKKLGYLVEGLGDIGLSVIVDELQHTVNIVVASDRVQVAVHVGKQKSIK